MNIATERLTQIADKPTVAMMWEVREMASKLLTLGGESVRQDAVTYRRSINRTLALWLIELVRRYEQDPRYYSVSEPWSLTAVRGTGDIAKLRFWNLIVNELNNDPKKRCSGKWRPTDLAMQFVRGEIKLPRTALVRDGKLIGKSGKQVAISDCLKEPFDYSKLMAEATA